MTFEEFSWNYGPAGFVAAAFLKVLADAVYAKIPGLTKEVKSALAEHEKRAQERQEELMAALLAVLERFDKKASQKLAVERRRKKGQDAAAGKIEDSV